MNKIHRNVEVLQAGNTNVALNQSPSNKRQLLFFSVPFWEFLRMVGREVGSELVRRHVGRSEPSGFAGPIGSELVRRHVGTTEPRGVAGAIALEPGFPTDSLAPDSSTRLLYITSRLLLQPEGTSNRKLWTSKSYRKRLQCTSSCNQHISRSRSDGQSDLGWSS